MMRWLLLFVFLQSGFSVYGQDKKGIDSAGTSDTVIIDGNSLSEAPHARIDLSKFFGDNVKYPEGALVADMQGKVYVKAIIDTSGSLENIQLAKGITNDVYGINEEAMRVTRLIPPGSFEPGKLNGKPVRVWVTIPVRFVIDNGKKPKKEKKRKRNK